MRALESRLAAPVRIPFSLVLSTMSAGEPPGRRSHASNMFLVRRLASGPRGIAPAVRSASAPVSRTELHWWMPWQPDEIQRRVTADILRLPVDTHVVRAGTIKEKNMKMLRIFPLCAMLTMFGVTAQRHSNPRRRRLPGPARRCNPPWQCSDDRPKVARGGCRWCGYFSTEGARCQHRGVSGNWQPGMMAAPLP